MTSWPLGKETSIYLFDRDWEPWTIQNRAFLNNDLEKIKILTSYRTLFSKNKHFFFLKDSSVDLDFLEDFYTRLRLLTAQ